MLIETRMLAILIRLLLVVAGLCSSIRRLLVLGGTYRGSAPGHPRPLKVDEAQALVVVWMRRIRHRLQPAVRLRLSFSGV